MDRSACVEARARAEHGEGETTDEFGAGICCHASGFEESDGRYSHLCRHLEYEGTDSM